MLKFAVTGCGRMGLAHTQRLMSDPRSTVVAFHDPLREAAEHLQRRCAPQAAVYSSFEQMLQQTACDAVVIATPTTSHHDQLVGATNHNLHVLCEKPLAGDRDAILKLVELCHSRRDLHLMLGYQRRCWTLYRRLKSELQSGNYGAIRAVTSVSAERWQQTITDTWRDDPSINYGGYLGDAGSHKIDIIFYLTELAPRDVFAVSHRCGSQVEIATSVTATLGDDVPLTMSFTGHASSFHEELFIHCEKADLIIRDLELLIGIENEVTSIAVPPDECGRDSTRNPVTVFLDLLTGAGPNIAPFDCAVPIYDFTSAILASARNGRREQLA
jgi:predicted dehydrogenase